MRSQPWVATTLFAVIAFGGGYAARFYESRTDVSGGSTGAVIDLRAHCYFSPRGGCTQAIVAEIDAAKNTIELEGYAFTSKPIGNALLSAHQRGVDVKLVLDASKSNEDRREVDYVARRGVPVYLDARHAIFHNKVVLIDDRTLITGSFNFTHAAEEENAENIVILHDQPKLQSAYEDNFREHLSHSERYEGR